MKLPAIRLPLPLLLLALVFVAPPAVEADGEGKDAPMSTLLVKVPKAHVQDLVAWTHAKGGRVIDTETMTRLVPAGEPKAEPKPVVKREDLPKLASARAMFEALNALPVLTREGSKERALQFDSISVTARDVKLRLVADDGDVIDTFRKALGSDTTIVRRARGGVRGIEVGSIQRLKDGRVRSDMRVRLAFAYEGKAEIPEVAPTLNPAAIEVAAANAKVRLTYASALRVDLNRKEGTALYYRDYQFASMSGEVLVALLSNLEQSGATVTEIHLRIGKDEVQKPRIRLAVIDVIRD